MVMGFKHRRWLFIVLLVMVIAYASLFTYAHMGRTVLKYVGPGYVVEYVRYPELPWPPLNILTFSPPNEYPLINIAITNAPPTPYPPHANARFFIYATGPSVGGFVDVGHYLSNSTDFVIDVGNYTAYALELDNYLRMTPPDVAGPSIILFISTITNTSSGPSVITGFVAVPIIPVLAKGSVINVVINYTRVVKVGLTVNATGALSFQDPSTQPPGTASAGCVFVGGGTYKGGEECWYWQLNTVLLTQDDAPFPVVAQVIRSSEVDYVGESNVQVSIELSQSTYTGGAGFTLSLAIPTTTGVNVEIPGG